MKCPKSWNFSHFFFEKKEKKKFFFYCYFHDGSHWVWYGCFWYFLFAIQKIQIGFIKTRKELLQKTGHFSHHLLCNGILYSEFRVFVSCQRECDSQETEYIYVLSNNNVIFEIQFLVGTSKTEIQERVLKNCDGSEWWGTIEHITVDAYGFDQIYKMKYVDVKQTKLSNMNGISQEVICFNNETYLTLSCFERSQESDKVMEHICGCSMDKMFIGSVTTFLSLHS